MLTAVAAGAAVALTACTRTTPPTAARPARGLSVTGPREEVLAVGEHGMLNFPDGHVSYLPTADGRRAWFSSGLPGGAGRTVALDSPDLERWTPAVRDGRDAAPGLVPPGGTTAFDADYSAPGSVVRSDDGDPLWMVYHGENHTFAGVTYDLVPFYQTIGLASSDDGGATWSRRGVVISGQVPRDDLPAAREAIGAGTPCGLVAGDQLYVFYVDLTLTAPDEIHVARVPLAEVADPAAWRKWHQGSFGTPAAGGASTPVVRRPGSGAESVYTGYPSVSWNTELGRYLMVFESRDGYWWTDSTDLVEWSSPQKLLDADGPEIGGVAFVSYPSLLSPGAETDQETGRTAYLYLGIAERPETSHSLWRIPITVSA